MWIHFERLHNHNKAKTQQNRVHISWDILYVSNGSGNTEQAHHYPIIPTKMYDAAFASV